MVQFHPPVEGFLFQKNVVQLFGYNAQFYQAAVNQKSHPGIDIVIPNDPDNGYGRPIQACLSGKVTRLDTDFPTKIRGTTLGITTPLADGGYIEVIYHHLSDVLVQLGAMVNAGENICLMGNTGFVRPIPTKERPYDGTHLHLGVRLYDRNGHRLPSEWDDYVNPLPYMYRPGIDKIFDRVIYNLAYGSSGNNVALYQQLLVLEGIASYQPTGFFGAKTAADTMTLQRKLGFTPVGIAGPKTREYLNSKYCI